MNNETIMLEEIGHSEVYSVFVFGYNKHFNCFERYFLDENLDEFQKFEEVNKLEKSFSIFIENFRKAENAKKAIFDYVENPSKYYSYSEETGQITQKSTSEINHKFDDFVTAIYRTYKSFFEEFIDRFDIDKNDLYKEYYLEVSTKKDDLYKYLCLPSENTKASFDDHFKTVRDIIEDIKERRNYGIDHNFGGRKLELEGRLLYQLNKSGDVVAVDVPVTDFNKRKISIFEYVDHIFNNLMVHFQHIIAMYSNNLLEKHYEALGRKDQEINSLFYDINFLKDLYKDKYEEFSKHWQTMSSFQRYHFGVFMQGQFVPMSCSGVIDPKIRYQGHIDINIQEPYFSQIKSGKKTVEGRMSSNKFRSIKSGDRILINRRLPALVEEVKSFSSFEEMFDFYGLKNCLPDKITVEEGLSVYNTFYKHEDVVKHGVIAFKISIQNY